MLKHGRKNCLIEPHATGLRPLIARMRIALVRGGTSETAATNERYQSRFLFLWSDSSRRFGDVVEPIATGRSLSELAVIQ